MNEIKSKIDVSILQIMFKFDAKNADDGIEINAVASNLERFGINLHHQTIWRRMNNLKKMGYIDKGLELSKANTYYLLQKGIDRITERR